MATIRTLNWLPVGEGVEARTSAPAASPGVPPVGFCGAAPVMVCEAPGVVPAPAVAAVAEVGGAVAGGVTPGVCCGVVIPAGTVGAEEAVETSGCPDGMTEGPCGMPRRVAERVVPTDRLANGDPTVAGAESAAPGASVPGAAPAAEPTWEPVADPVAADVPAARADGCERPPWVATLPPTDAIRSRTFGTRERTCRITSTFWGREKFV
jgi:hypothetical protein